MTYREAALVAQVILGTFFLSAVAGMVFVAWRRAREDRLKTVQPKSQAVRVRRNPLPLVSKWQFTDEEWARLQAFRVTRQTKNLPDEVFIERKEPA